MSVAQKMFFETIDVTIPHTIEDTNKEEFHQIRHGICHGRTDIVRVK